MIPYVRVSEISSSPQLSHDDVSIKVVIAIQFFLCLGWWNFCLVPWQTQLRTTSHIHFFSVYSTHSSPIYLLHSQNPPKSIFLSLLSDNWVILIITLTLALIEREKPLLSGNRVVVTLNPKSTKEIQRHWQILFSYFLSLVVFRGGGGWYIILKPPKWCSRGFYQKLLNCNSDLRYCFRTPRRCINMISRLTIVQ